MDSRSKDSENNRIWKLIFDITTNDIFLERVLQNKKNYHFESLLSRGEKSHSYKSLKKQHYKISRPINRDRNDGRTRSAAAY